MPKNENSYLINTIYHFHRLILPIIIMAKFI